MFQLIAKNGTIGRDLIGRSTGELEWGASPILTEMSTGYRQSITVYSVGDIAYHSSLPTGWYLECTTGGTSSSGELTISSHAVGSTVSDGTVVWIIRKIMNTSRLIGFTNEGKLTAELNQITAGNTAGINIIGGSDSNSPMLTLLGKNNPNETEKGKFVLKAYDGTNSSNLLGKPLGTLQWNGTDLAGAAIVAKSIGNNGYVKYASGLIIQWGLATYSQAEYINRYPISFPTIAFRPIGVLNGTDVLAVSLQQNDAMILAKEGFVGLSTAYNKGGSYIIFGY